MAKSIGMTRAKSKLAELVGRVHMEESILF
jgi:hypothetical protein